MKDYYKILGVSEDASAEEIRASWIELTKHYHPDLRKTDGEDEKIKEINEAYEVLKDYPKRQDYDLQRAIQKSIRKKIRVGKGGMSLSKKIIFSAGLLAFFLLVGLILFESLWVPVQPKSELRFEISKIIKKRPVLHLPPPEVKEEVDEEVKKAVKKEVKREVKKEVRKEVKMERKIPKEIPPPSLSPAEKESRRKEEVVLQEMMRSEMPEKVDKEAPKEAAPVTPPPGETLPSEAKEEKEAPKEVGRVISQKSARVDQPAPIVTEPQPVQKPETLVKANKVIFTPPSLLAKEEEVKQFLSDYINRYIRKDINGFLSFFSSKAVQNQKDDFEKIRSIYTEFFDQSEELRYGLEGLKIEIYQNSVEVKARYKVYQKLKKRGKEKLWIGNILWVLVKEGEALRISLLDYQNEKSP